VERRLGFGNAQELDWKREKDEMLRKKKKP